MTLIVAPKPDANEEPEAPASCDCDVRATPLPSSPTLYSALHTHLPTTLADLP